MQPIRSYSVRWKICVFIMLAFVNFFFENSFINKCTRKNLAKIPERRRDNSCFWDNVEELTFLNIPWRELWKTLSLLAWSAVNQFNPSACPRSIPRWYEFFLSSNVTLEWRRGGKASFIRCVASPKDWATSPNGWLKVGWGHISRGEKSHPN